MIEFNCHLSDGIIYLIGGKDSGGNVTLGL